MAQPGSAGTRPWGAGGYGPVRRPSGRRRTGVAVLSQAIGETLPNAVGVALSPFPIIGVVLVLGTPKARSNGPAFAVGWVVGLTVVCAVVLALTGGASDPSSDTSTGINWIQVGLGVLFLGMARRQWASRPAKGEEAEMPAWMEAVDEFSAGRSLGLGFVLSAVNPKTLALTAGAAASIAQLGLSSGDEVAAVAVFVLIASITVAGPVLYYLVATERATGALGTLKEFMAANSNVIMMIVLVVFGAKFLGEGLGALGS